VQQQFQPFCTPSENSYKVIRARVHLVQRFVPALFLEVYCLPTHAAYMAVTRSTQIQGHNEVRWRPGQETSLAPPFSNLRPFGSKCTVLKKVLVTLLGLFGSSAVIRRPHSDSAHGELCPPCTPSLRPWSHELNSQSSKFVERHSW